MSILRQAAKDRRQQRLILLYSNRRPDDAAFLAELQQLESKNSNFRPVATMTEMHASHLPWAGQKGLVTGEIVKSAVDDLSAPIFYVAGPPGMVVAMRQTLNGVGIDDDDVRVRSSTVTETTPASRHRTACCPGNPGTERRVTPSND